MVSIAKAGSRRAILERLQTWIEGCLYDNDYYVYTVSVNRDLQVNTIKNMPVITISLGTETLEPDFYDRQYPTKGITASIPFTMFIYHWKDHDNNVNHNYRVSLLTDRIIKYLRSKDGDYTEKSVYGINRVYDLSSRESDPSGLNAVVRKILDGTIEAYRLDG